MFRDTGPYCHPARTKVTVVPETAKRNEICEVDCVSRMLCTICFFTRIELQHVTRLVNNDLHVDT